MDWLPVLPILVPLATAVLALAVRGPARRAVSLVGGTLLFAAAVALFASVAVGGMQVVQIGDWRAPIGITLAVDVLSAVMVVLAAGIGLATAVYSVGDRREDEHPLFHPTFHVLLMGVCGAFVTGDLFNLYVWFEVLLIASFVLLVVGNPRGREPAIHYVAINLVSSAFFLAAVGLVYAATGTLNMAELAVRLPEVPAGASTAIASLLLVAFGIKAALFPLYFWLPAAYPVPRTAVAAVFAGLLTKVGVYALIRVFTLLFNHDLGYVQPLLLGVALATMVAGVLGAAAQRDARRILSFHIVSQIGYMVLGLALLTPLALVGALVYLIHHIVVKANLFLVAGAITRRSGGDQLRDWGGTWRAAPWLALLFAIPALSLAGLPPLSGFWAKLTVIQASLEAEAWLAAGAALAVGFLTLYSMTKIWLALWQEPAPSPAAPVSATSAWCWMPMASLAAVTVAIGVWPEPVFSLAGRAAAELLDPSIYVAAVLGGPL